MRGGSPTPEAAMKPVYLAALLLAAWLLGGCVGPSSEDRQLRRELAQARAQIDQAREEARAKTLACQDLAKDRKLALASARQLRSDTQYLRTSTAKMSDAITRLSYQDWNR